MKLPGFIISETEWIAIFEIWDTFWGEWIVGALQKWIGPAKEKLE